MLNSEFNERLLGILRFVPPFKAAWAMHKAWNCRDRDPPPAAADLHLTPSCPTLPSGRGADEPGVNNLIME